MNWKTTWLLLALAAVLLAFICLVERHLRPTAATAAPPGPLLAFRPTEVTNLVLRRTNQLALRAERTGPNWNLTVPICYPAQTFAVDRLLQTLAGLSTRTYLSPQDLAGRQRTVAEYGLDVPAATLELQHGGQRTEVLFGARTAVGDQVYVQLLNAPGIYVVGAEVFDLLPRSPNDWRDQALVNLAGLNLDRIEVRSPGRGFAIEVNPTNKLLYLSKPAPGPRTSKADDYARASVPKVEGLMRKVQTAQIAQFVTDDPRAELEPFGLQPPEAELAFGQGTNDLVVVQFGKSPTNDPALVYARRLSQTNIVLVPKPLLEALQVSQAELRDRHLLSFVPAAVDTIEVTGDEPFSLRRQTNGLWMMAEPQPQLADAEVVRDWLNQLGALEGTVEKDVVTDLAPYGLAPPARQYLLKTTVTNANGSLTNRLLAQLDLGARREEKVFAHGVDESVYSIGAAEFERLPTAAWQLRDRRVWTFTTNQVTRVSVTDRGYTRQLVRNSSGEWSLAPGSQGVINTLAVEEMMLRLGELTAVSWTARGEDNRTRYGFLGQSLKLAIELKVGDKTRTLNLEFSGRPPSPYPYALATLDGQSWIFEFPLKLYYELIHYLGNPPPAARAAQ